MFYTFIISLKFLLMKHFSILLADLSKRKNNVVPTNNINNKNSSTRSQFGGSVPNSQNEATRQMLLNRIQYATNTGMINPQVCVVLKAFAHNHFSIPTLAFFWLYSIQAKNNHKILTFSLHLLFFTIFYH